VQYPADWLRARHIVEADRLRGSVLLLPWAQYRRYPWNHGEAVFDPWPRFVARPMIWNDALRVGRTTVPAESERARELTPVISSRGPLTAVLTAAGVRYVVVDSGPLLRPDQKRHGHLAALARLPGAQVVIAGPDLVLFRLPARSSGTAGSVRSGQFGRTKLADWVAEITISYRSGASTGTFPMLGPKPPGSVAGPARRSS
jgi:hypothetical protein